MALSMFALLFTAFLPKVGRAFRLGALSLDRRPAADGFHPLPHRSLHILHGLLVDLARQQRLHDATRRTLRFFGKPAPPPSSFAKYPIENKLYHGVIMLWPAWR